MTTKSTVDKNRAVDHDEGFFKRLFGGLGSPKKRILRILKRELSTARIDLYRLKHDTISVPIARMLYEIYRLTYPLRQFFQLDKKTRRFTPSFEENFLLSFHNEEALAIYGKLNEESIRKVILKYGVKKATRIYEKLLSDYFDLFDRQVTMEINSIYTNLINFARFVYYDFYALLREFDPSLEEDRFLKKPSFSPAEGTLLRDEIYTLQTHLMSFNVNEKLDRGMEIASKIRGGSPLDQKHYSRLKHLITEIKDNNYLVLIIRAIDKSLAPVTFPKPAVIDIYSAFSFKIKGTVFSTINSIKDKLQEDALRSIISKIFEGDVVGRIKNYSELKNEQFATLGLPQFVHAEALNYLKAFLTDKYKSKISRLVNELIIGGIFLNKGILNALSNSYYALNDVLAHIVALDDDLDIDGNSGKTINRLMLSMKKEKSARKILEKTINDINHKAKFIIDEALLNIKDMALCLKKVIEDFKKEKPTIVSNIRKIRVSNNTQFIKELVAAYKDIYYFLRLMGLFVSLKISRADIERQKEHMTLQQ